MLQMKIGWVLLSLISLAIATACGPQRDTEGTAKMAGLVLNDRVANHAFWVGVGQTVSIELINTSTPAWASDPLVLKLMDSFDTTSGKVTLFNAVRPGATVIQPGIRTCGLVACANSGPASGIEEFYILVTDSKDPVRTVLSLQDHGAIVALRQDERAAVLLPNKAPFSAWMISGAGADPLLVQEHSAVTSSFSWAIFTSSRIGRTTIRATANPDCNAGAAGCPLSPRQFSVMFSVVATGAATVLALGDQDNGAWVDLNSGGVLELVLRRAPFDTGEGSVVSSHPGVLVRASSSTSSGASKLDFRAVDGGFTQLLSVDTNCGPTGNHACQSLYELNVFVFP
jgi:hypothetical protein